MTIPNMDNGGRWDHIASETECARVLKDNTAEVLEATVIENTWIVSMLHMTILRCGAVGGDVFNVEGGWVYANPFSMMRDLEEIRTVASLT